MNQLKNLKKEEEGFTLIELLVVVIIAGVLAAIGIPAWQNMVLKSQAAGAKTVIANIKKECQSNRDLGVDEVFTPMTPSGYSVQPQGSLSCYGDPGTGLVSAVPNEVKNPTYFYEHLTSLIRESNTSKNQDKVGRYGGPNRDENGNLVVDVTGSTTHYGPPACFAVRGRVYKDDNDSSNHSKWVLLSPSHPKAQKGYSSNSGYQPCKGIPLPASKDGIKPKPWSTEIFKSNTSSGSARSTLFNDKGQPLMLVPDSGFYLMRLSTEQPGFEKEIRNMTSGIK